MVANPLYTPAWSANPGSQQLFLSTPFKEVLFEGTRGCGKTDALLTDFGKYVGRGYGPSWRGVLFRETFPQLKDIIAKSKILFRQSFPGADYNKTEHTWTFPGGEQLILSFMKTVDDYWNYHGHEYPWIGWEELCNWPTNECYEMMKSCNRSSFPDMPRRYVSTANPYGVGHGWVKQYWIDCAPPGVPVTDENGEKRVRIKGYWWECKQLVENDPEYVNVLKSLKDENLKKAWLDGSWDIVAGGAIIDVWQPSIHVIRPFQIPDNWYVDRSFDWGSSHPFSVGWWAESDGTEVEYIRGVWRAFPKHTLFRIGELYGWNGKPNEGNRMLSVNIAKKIYEMEQRMDFDVHPGPADSQIFTTEDGKCIADEMKAPPYYIRWKDVADKRKGSRVGGLEILRQLLWNSCQMPMEDPGIFIFDVCTHWLRTVPVLPRAEDNMDDVNTAAEDHAYDDTRYRIKQKIKVVQEQDIIGF